MLAQSSHPGPSSQPFVKATSEGLQWLLTKPVNKKEPCSNSRNVGGDGQRCWEIRYSFRSSAGYCIDYTLPLLTTIAFKMTYKSFLPAWAEKWKITFNICKCCIMQLFKHHHKSKFPYSMSGQDPRKVEQHPYLGVIIDHQLSRNPHIDYVRDYAMKQFRFLIHNLQACSKTLNKFSSKLFNFRLFFICLGPLPSGWC